MTVVSESKLAANRRNALKSTGPRTARGKKRSSQNARKHGLFSRTLVQDDLGVESTKAFQAFLKSLYDDLKPQSLLDRFWVERAAASLWRFQRAYRLEAGAIQNSADPQSHLPDFHCLPRLVRYENMLDRHLQRALSALRYRAGVPESRPIRNAVAAHKIHQSSR